MSKRKSKSGGEKQRLEAAGARVPFVVGLLAVVVASLAPLLYQTQFWTSGPVVIPRVVRNGIPVTQRHEVTCCGVPRRHVDSLSVEALALHLVHP